MKYRKLGNTGLLVSEVALGTMQFGGKMNMGNLGQEDTTRMVKLALDRASTSLIPRTYTASGRAKLLSVMPCAGCGKKSSWRRRSGSP
jgi:hypothetical protein